MDEKKEPVIEESNSKLSKKDLIALIILSALVFIIEIFGMYGRTTFMRDWTHLFEGSYRIFLGQVPYQDFFTPIGPIIFEMQAFFMHIFGPNVFSLIIHSFSLTIILLPIFYYFLRKEFNIIVSFTFSVFFYISFSGLTFYPLYNYTSFFFFFLNLFMLLYYIKKDSLPAHVYLLSAIFGTLDFYTKQDTGGLHLLFLFIYFSFNYRKDWKKILIFYLIPAIVFMAGTFFGLSHLDGFTYWYNYGQPPHSTNFNKFFEQDKLIMIVSSWYFYVSLLFIFLILFKKIDANKKRIMSLFVILAVTHLVSNTLSGSTRQLSVMGLPILIFFMYLLVKDSIKCLEKNYKFFMFLLLLLILIININPIPTYGLITLNYLNPNMEKIKEGCAAGVLIDKQSYESLQTIREAIKKYPDFISITEFNFLYCDYNIEPPKDLPLCFKQGYHFYKQDLDGILKTILSYNSTLILLQDAHGHDDRDLNNKLADFFVSKDYVKIDSVNTLSTPEAPIVILVLKDKLSKKDSQNLSVFQKSQIFISS